MRSFWKKLLSLLSSPMTFILALVGCHVPYVEMLYAAPVPALEISGKVIDADTEAELTNIRVSLLKGDTVLESKTNGYYFIYYSAEQGSYSLIANDIDGTNNGGDYLTTTNRFSVNSFPFSTNITIKMQKQ